MSNKAKVWLEEVSIPTYNIGSPEKNPIFIEKRVYQDSRFNNALGLWFLRQRQFAKIQSLFEKLIDTIAERNPNPVNNEPYNNLEISLYYRKNTTKHTIHYTNRYGTPTL